MHPTLARPYPFLLGSPARCTFLSYFMFIYMFRISCYISTKSSAVALTGRRSKATQSWCHGPCSVTFFLKNNHYMAPMESLMMATSPLFSATLTTSHPRRTYIGPPSEFFLYSDTTNKSSFLSLPLPTSTMCYLPQHNQSPTMLHTCSMS